MSGQDNAKGAVDVRGRDIDPKTGREIDPVCGMTVHRHAFYRTTFENKVYKFCNEDCLKTFKADPLKYVGISRDVMHNSSETKTHTDKNYDNQHAYGNKEKGCCCNNDENKQCCSHKNEESDILDLKSKNAQDDI